MSRLFRFSYQNETSPSTTSVERAIEDPVEHVRLRFILKCSLSHARLSSARHVRTSSSRWQQKRKGDKDEVDEKGTRGVPFECVRKLSPLFRTRRETIMRAGCRSCRRAGCVAESWSRAVLSIKRQIFTCAFLYGNAYRINRIASLSWFRLLLSARTFSCSR